MGKGSVYLRGDVWWIAYYDVSGKRRCVSTGLRDQKEAECALTAVARKVTAEKALGASGGTLAAYFEAQWLPQRKQLGLSNQKDEEARIRIHAIPKLGAMRLEDIGHRDIIGLIRELRSQGLAARTVRNIIGALSLVLRDAVVDDLIPRNPCDLLRRGDLPPVRDADPAWRAQAVYQREEVEALLTDVRIPLSRRIDYAIAALTGARSGERFFLRWRHWDAERKPLGCLAFEGSFNTKLRAEKGTKTETPRYFPVHPLLALMLEEWRAAWAGDNGHEPTQEDLIVPHNGAHRTNSVAWKALQKDLATIGIRGRRVHDFRRTTVSLAMADGARKDIMQTLTHPSPSQAFDLYLTLPWAALCSEVAKLNVATSLLHSEWRRRESNGRLDSNSDTTKAASASVNGPLRWVEPTHANDGCSKRSSTFSREERELLWFAASSPSPASEAGHG